MEKDHGQLCSGGVATPADAALMIGGNAKQDCPVCIILQGGRRIDKGRIKGTIISALKITLPLSFISAFILVLYTV